jgi:hypothetical protein
MDTGSSVCFPIDVRVPEPFDYASKLPVSRAYLSPSFPSVFRLRSLWSFSIEARSRVPAIAETLD